MLTQIKARLQQWFYQGAWGLVAALVALAVLIGAVVLTFAVLTIGAVLLLAGGVGLWLARSRLARRPPQSRRPGQPRQGQVLEGEYTVITKRHRLDSPET